MRLRTVGLLASLTLGLKSTAVLALVVGLMLSSSAYAGCLKDRAGEVICGAGPCLRDLDGQVYCSQFRFGSIVRTGKGQSVCGRGQCVTNMRGEVICSNIEGGAVVKLTDGTIRCEGECERASLDMCERTPAGR